MSTNIVVPEMGESIVDARVARWLKKPGDAVAAGEALVELETDKVDVEVSAPSAGVLESIAHPAGPEGTRFCRRCNGRGSGRQRVAARDSWPQPRRMPAASQSLRRRSALPTLPRSRLVRPARGARAAPYPTR